VEIYNKIMLEWLAAVAHWLKKTDWHDCEVTRKVIWTSGIQKVSRGWRETGQYWQVAKVARGQETRSCRGTPVTFRAITRLCPWQGSNANSSSRRSRCYKWRRWLLNHVTGNVWQTSHLYLGTCFSPAAHAFYCCFVLRLKRKEKYIFGEILFLRYITPKGVYCWVMRSISGQTYVGQHIHTLSHQYGPRLSCLDYPVEKHN
jgi:hypothetical protein